MVTRAAAFAQWACAAPPLTSRRAALAGQALVDTLACAAAGASDDAVVAVARGIGADGPGGRSLCVDGVRRGAAAAAAINGTAAHAVDYDDNFTPGMSHASAVIVPALLAVTDADPTVVGRVLDAYGIGLQAQAFVGSLVGYRHYVAGWHATSTVGCIGTAAAVAYLRDPDPVLIERAMTVAASYAAGTKVQFGSSMKAVHAGLAARAAVESVLICEAGGSGARDALEGPQGFAALFGAGGEPGDGSAWIGTRIAIEDPGVLPKRYPSCGSTHLVLDAIEDLRRETGFRPEDVRAVDTTIGRANLGSLPYRRPATGRQARFSMDYCVEVFLQSSALGLVDFTDERVAAYLDRPRPFSLSQQAWATETETLAAEPQHPPHRVRITLTDGTVLSRTRHLPRGSVREPLTEAERRAKFLDCCGPDAEGLYERLQGFHDAPDTEAVTELLELAARPTTGNGRAATPVR